MLGATVNKIPLLGTAETVTTTLPVVAVAGTLTVMLPVPQLEAVPAEMPLKVTVLVLWLLPKLLPVIVIAVPMAPEFWLSVLMIGAGGGGPVAALNAARPAAQLSDAASFAVTEAVPAVLCL
jgi:hypothetical protein